MQENAYVAGAICNILKTSLGPNAQRKILADQDKKEVVVSSSAAVILRFLYTSHPVAVLLIEVTSLQVLDYSDGSTSLALLASQLVENGHKLITKGITRNKIVSGFTKAVEEVVTLIDTKLKFNRNIDWLNTHEVQEVIDNSLRSNNIPEHDFLSTLITDALERLESKIVPNMHIAPHDDATKRLQFICTPGDTVDTSKMLSGILLSNNPISTTKELNTPVKVAVFGVPLQERKPSQKVIESFQSAEQLARWKRGEEEFLRDMAVNIVDAGANVIISAGIVHPAIMHWFNRHKVLVLENVANEDTLRSICVATGATVCYQPEAIDELELGVAQSVETLQIAGNHNTFIHANNIMSFFICGPTVYKCEDVKSHCEDALATLRALKRNNEVIVGGGAAELQFYTHLKMSARQNHIGSVEQSAIEAFAEACLIIPRALIENAGADHIPILQQLLHMHNNGEANMGVSMETGAAADMRQSRVFDVVTMKKRLLQLATDAACTILRIDENIAAKSSGSGASGGQ